MTPPDVAKAIQQRLVSAAQLKASIQQHARYSLGKTWPDCSPRERFICVSLAVREPIIDAMLETRGRFEKNGAKRIYYLSLEFLMGRALGNNLLNLGLYQPCVQALMDLDADLEEVLDVEPDPALGNGGLGRLAACFVDSMATMGLAGYGYGINYEFGLFKQTFEDGWQQELPDVWRSPGTPWLILRPNLVRHVPVYGHAERPGRHQAGKWLGTQNILGVPSDLPVVGYGGKTVNHLRLYAAQSDEHFDMEIFNTGDYIRAVEAKIETERISKVLYPSDDIPAGRELRLLQEWFFVSCSIQDILAQFGDDLGKLPDRVAIQLNDTHPALAVAELMRQLVDERGVPWDAAFDLTVRTIAYTNHTLLPEAQERWPVEILERVLPRHLQIIFDINDRFLETVAERWPDDDDRRRSLSLVEEGGARQVRMMNLCVVGSHAVNGVSELHSRLLREDLVPDFSTLWPERFRNKTNGVTQRRWILRANPPLAGLLTRHLGERWITDLEALRELEPLVDDDAFLTELRRIKRWHKEKLAKSVLAAVGRIPDPASIHDVQIKRIHEYKRQLMNALRIAYDYLRITEDSQTPVAPRTYLFGGKAAPGYATAKQIIRLINELANVINADPRVADWMTVAFLPDYKVTVAERVIPASDVSEQISTAGMEASGTGNMKFMMNGALTVGTLDGANIEMLEEAGAENFYIFGLTAEEIATKRRAGGPEPQAIIAANEDLARVLTAIRSGPFAAGGGLFGDLLDGLEQHDPYFVLADFAAFIEVQDRVARDWLDERTWSQRCARNILRSTKFSSDRTIREYAGDIWKAETT